MRIIIAALVLVVVVVLVAVASMKGGKNEFPDGYYKDESGKIYQVASGTKKWIVNPAAYAKLGNPPAANVPNVILSKLTAGADITA